MAEDPAIEEEQTEQPVAAPVKKESALGKIILVVVMALVSSASGGAVSWYLISKTLAGQAHTAEKGPEQAEEEKVAEMLEKSFVMPLEPFVVNLADTEAPRYLRITITLMVDDKTKAAELTENQALTLKVRDVILQNLTLKTSQDLINEDGKNKLRQEILAKIGVYFREPKLVDVMFTEFVIQL